MLHTIGVSFWSALCNTPQLNPFILYNKIIL
nr:MAG TPA: hypothetical protein [Caudoviricetes sp.]